MVAGPTNICEVGKELLFAEFAATPGSRIDGVVTRLSKEQLADEITGQNERLAGIELALRQAPVVVVRPVYQ